MPKKKIKDLTSYEVLKICKKYPLECSNKCPLYRIEKNRLRLCMIIDKENYNCTKKELKKLEKEIEVEE